MELDKLFSNKALKNKEKTEMLSHLLIEKPQFIQDVLAFAKLAKDPIKATCIEAIEYATKQGPQIATKDCLDFVTSTLSEKAPRIKWESARVIGNIAHLFPTDLEEAIHHLIQNTENSGTVVRWSAAFALGEIVKLGTNINKDLVPILKSICLNEEKPSIQKIYLTALKKLEK